MKTFALVGAIAVAALATGIAVAATTVPTGTALQTVLDRGVNSSTAKVGDNFKLLIDDPSQPALAGAAIHGSVTDVAAPGGMTRARIGFILSFISFGNGTRAAIHATVVGKNVTQTNTAALQKEQVKFSLPSMVGATPSPVVWQIHFRRDEAPSVTPPPAGNTSGYVYAPNSHQNIVIPPGAPVTIRLTSDLTAP